MIFNQFKVVLDYFRFLFRRSYSVHFYGQITGKYKTGNGANTAYDYLGPKLCPQTYSLRNNMDDITWNIITIVLIIDMICHSYLQINRYSVLNKGG